MDYSDMKATKSESNAEKLKKALDATLDGLTQDAEPQKKTTKKSSSSGTKKSSTGKSSSKSSSSKNTSKKSTGSKSSGTKNSTGKSTGGKSSSGATKSSSGKRTSTKSHKNSGKDDSKISTMMFETPIKIMTVEEATKSKNNSSKPKKEKNSKSALTVILIFVFLAVGILGGFLGTRLVCANDVYEMKTYADGSIDVTIGENEDMKVYSELGVKCIAFGKDCSKKYKVSYYFRNKMTEDEVPVGAVGEKGEGIYYAVYSAPSKKYSSVKLIRNIIVLRGENDEQN